MKDKFFVALLVLFFASPILILFYHFSLNFDVPYADFLRAFKNSLFQSATAAVICLGSAIILAPGLARTSSKVVRVFEKLALAPSLLPTLITVLIIFSYVPHFPFGHWGIIGIFSFMYFGYATVAVKNVYVAHVLHFEPIAEVYGISQFDRQIKIYLPPMFKGLGVHFFIIFVACFSSLSVPLLAGGGKGYNVELLIFENIFINGNWGFATALTLAQTALLIALSAVILRGSNVSKMSGQRVSTSRPFSAAAGVLMLYVGLYLGGYLIKVAYAFVVSSAKFDGGTWLRALASTYVFMFLTVILFMCLLLALAYLRYRQVRFNFLTYFITPSVTLVGFAYYLWFPQSESSWINLIKLALCMNIVYSLVLYKTYYQAQFERLERQLDVSRVFGFNFTSTLGNIFYPQLRAQIFLSILVFVTIGLFDFALVRAAGIPTLLSGVFIENHISSYRLDLGYIYSFLTMASIGMGAMILYLLGRVLHVRSQ